MVSEAKRESRDAKVDSQLIDLARISAKTAISRLDNAEDALTIAIKRFSRAGKRDLVRKANIILREIRLIKRKIHIHLS